MVWEIHHDHIVLENGATIPTPATGYTTFYPNSSGNFYQKLPSGTASSLVIGEGFGEQIYCSRLTNAITAFSVDLSAYSYQLLNIVWFAKNAYASSTLDYIRVVFNDAYYAIYSNQVSYYSTPSAIYNANLSYIGMGAAGNAGSTGRQWSAGRIQVGNASNDQVKPYKGKWYVPHAASGLYQGYSNGGVAMFEPITKLTFIGNSADLMENSVFTIYGQGIVD